MTEDNPTNVLSFPKKKITENLSDAQTKEEFTKQLSEHKERHVDMVLAKNMNQLYNRLGAEGFNIEDDVFFGDFCFVVEALKSALLRQCGIEHQLQKFVDENFESKNSKDLSNDLTEETEDE